MIRKKWWEKKAIQESKQWCVIGITIGYYAQDRWEEQLTTNYKPCHISNMPTNTTLITKNLTQHEAQALCKLLNLEGELK